MRKSQAEYIVEECQKDGLSNDSVQVTKLNRAWAVKIYNRTTSNYQTATDYAHSAVTGNW